MVENPAFESTMTMIPVALDYREGFRKLGYTRKDVKHDRLENIVFDIETSLSFDEANLAKMLHKILSRTFNC